MFEVSDAVDAVRSGVASVEKIARVSAAKAAADTFGAWASLNSKAVQDAREVDADFQEFPLAGTTLGVKDLFAVDGLPMRAGSKLTSEDVSKCDSALVASLRALGAVVIGTTRMPEFALGTTPGAANPCDVRRTAGSSSTGSAIAVAAGHVSLALATQTNASIIRPASYCGVAALKPTQGSLPAEGMLHLVPTLDQPGFIAPGVGSLATVWSALPRTSVTVPPVGPPIYSFVRTVRWARCERGARAALSELARSLQADDLVMPAEFNDAWFWMDTIMNVELAESLATYSDRLEQLTAPIQRAVLAGKATSRAQYREALSGRLALRDWADLHLGHADIVITPAAAGPAPLLHLGTGIPDFSTLWSLIGAPCITFPFTIIDGHLPIGIQLVAGRGNDERLLMAASELQSALRRSPLQLGTGASQCRA